jgi:hypothetical protein
MKYKFINGVPYYEDESNPVAKAIPLAVVATPEDVINMNLASQAQGINTQMPTATVTAVQYFNNPQSNFTAQYGSPEHLDGEVILRKISEIFSQYQVPLGLLPKLLELAEYNLNMLVDDSGSMLTPTKAKPYNASSFMQQFFSPDKISMTRWEEAEDILHIMIDLLAYIPTGIITIRFLNRPNCIVLDRRGMTPDQFAAQGHAQVRTAFTANPDGGTPLHEKINESFSSTIVNSNTIHYVLTDGKPTDVQDPVAVAELIKNRNAPEKNPVTLLGCTDKLKEIEWMEEMEGAEHIAVVNYFDLEKEDILEEQGRIFPYTRGLWLLGILVAAINPHDLGDLGSGHPLSKFTLDNLMGRNITPNEYKKYWLANPNHRIFSCRYNDFAHQKLSAREIIAAAKTESILTSMSKMVTCCFPMFSYDRRRQQQEDVRAHEKLRQQQQATPNQPVEYVPTQAATAQLVML